MSIAHSPDRFNKSGIQTRGRTLIPLLRFIGDSPGGTGGPNLNRVAHDHEQMTEDSHEDSTSWDHRLKHRFAHDDYEC